MVLSDHPCAARRVALFREHIVARDQVCEVSVMFTLRHVKHTIQLDHETKEVSVQKRRSMNSHFDDIELFLFGEDLVDIWLNLGISLDHLGPNRALSG